MASYYWGSDVTWEQYLRANPFVQDSNGAICKDGKQELYVISDKIKRIIAGYEALTRDFQQDYDLENSTLAEGFGIIGQPLEVISQGIEQLGAGFDYRISLLAEQAAVRDQALDPFLEHFDELRQISQTLPLEEELELYNTGREWFQKGLLDKALECFLKAARTKTINFLMQYSLGHLYLYGINIDGSVIDLGKAEKHFRDAARYAKAQIDTLPDAGKFCGEAYFHASVACYVQANEQHRGDAAGAKSLLREAANLAQQAAEIYPALVESFYLHAKACVLLGEKRVAVQSLERAIHADRNYCFKADVDRDFDSIRPDVLEFFEMLRQQAEEEAKHALQDTWRQLDEYVFITDNARRAKAHIEKLLTRAEMWYQHRTYFDYLDVLESCREGKRILEAFVPDHLLATLQGHTGSVRSVSFSRDTRYLASGSSDHTVLLWEVPSGRKIAALEGHTGNIYSVFFSPDGRYLVSRSADHTIMLWEVPSGKNLAILQGHGNLHSVSFSPDGRYLASGSSDHTVGLWQPWEDDSERALTMLRGHTKSVLSVAFSPDGRYLASGSDDHTVRLWNFPSRQKFAPLEGHTGAVHSVAFSPDGRYLASGSEDTSVRLWGVASREQIVTLQGHKKAVWMVSFSLDGQYLASRSDDHTVRLWEIPSGKELAAFQRHEDSVYSVSFSPNGRYLAAGSWDNTVEIWEISSRREFATFEGRSVAFSSDGRYLATGSRDGSVRLWGLPVLSKQEFWEQEKLEEKRIRQREEESKQREETEVSPQQTGFCLECGAKLSFGDKLLKKTKCKNCR